MSLLVHLNGAVVLVVTCSVLGVEEDNLTDSGSARKWESRRAWRLAERAAGAHADTLTGTWRTPLWYRLTFPVAGLYLLYGAVAYYDGGSELGITALSTGLGVLLTVGPFVPVVRLDVHTVYARGLVLHRVLALTEVVDVGPGYSGLSIESADGSVFEATGVGEKWNITRWLRRRTFADSVADQILDAAAVAQHGCNPGP